jgi:DnaK suppressor protein
MTNTTTIRAPGLRKKALEKALRETLGGFHREELEIEPMADPLDVVRWSMEREIAGRTLDQKAHRVREIRAALDRLGEGAFGTCERCEKPIGQKRLDAVPWATLCVSCQSEAESPVVALPLDRAA